MADEFKELVDDVKKELKEDIKNSKDAVIEEVKTQKAELKKEAVAWYNKLPSWGKGLLLAAALVGFGVYEMYVAKNKPVEPVVVNVTYPDNALVVNAAKPVDAVAAAEKADASRLLAKVLRVQTIKQLQAEGVDGKPLSKEAATALVNNLSDDDLVGVVEASGVLPAQGRVLDTLRAVVGFLINHKEEIKEIIKLIVLLLSAFM